MKIKKTLKSVLTAGLLASSLLSSYQARAEEKEEPSRFSARISYQLQGDKLKLDEAKTIGIQKDDSLFLTGSTTVKAKSGIEGLIFQPGIEAQLIRLGDFELTGGLDLRINLSSRNNEKDKSGLYDSKVQNSDTRGDWGSLVYDKLDANWYSFWPFLGVNYRMTESTKIGLEVSTPLLYQFEREWGHHRFNSEEKIGSETYDASGYRALLKLMSGDDNFYGWLGASVERLNLKCDNKSGSILGIGANLGLGFRFK